MHKLVATIVVFAAVAVCATAGGDKAGNLEGSWIAVSAVNDGKKIPAENIKKAMLTVTFSKGKYTIVAEGKEVEAGTYKINASKQPARLDLDVSKGEHKGETQIGIYKLDNDTLTVAMAPYDSKDRPTDFQIRKQGEVTVLKRAK